VRSFLDKIAAYLAANSTKAHYLLYKSLSFKIWKEFFYENI